MRLAGRRRRIDAIWPHEELDVDVGVVASVRRDGRTDELSVVGSRAVARMSGRRGSVGIAVASSQDQGGGGERSGRGSMMMRMIVISQTSQFNAHNDLSTARDALSLEKVRRCVRMVGIPILEPSLAPGRKGDYHSCPSENFSTVQELSHGFARLP